MTDIIIPLNKKGCKDCKDWVPLRDGTIVGDTKYCNKSFKCSQLHMRGDHYTFNKSFLYSIGYTYLEVEYYYPSKIYGDGILFDYVCTGMYIGKSEIEDKEAS